MSHNIDQQRATHALKTVRETVCERSSKTPEHWICKLSKDESSEWKSRANELPAMIQMNGLGATVAFYYSKGKTSTHRKLLDTTLKPWLCEGNQALYPNADNLMEAIINSDMHTYQIAQAEAQAYLRWVKKFSKIYCDKEKMGENS